MVLGIFSYHTAYVIFQNNPIIITLRKEDYKMYYIDAMESEMALFDFPGLSPATESSSEGIGSKLGKILKFIVKKIKEFIQRIIAIVRMLLGNKGPNAVMDLKKAAMREVNLRLKAYLPNKEVTDLTKIKGLSSYQGGESGPYISEAQADNIRQVVEDSLDTVSKEYTSAIKVMKSNISALRSIIVKTSTGSIKFAKAMSKATNQNDHKTVLFEYRNVLSSYSDISSKSVSIKNDIVSAIDASKKTTTEQVSSMITSKTNGVASEIVSAVKSIIGKYATNIKVALRTGDSDLNSGVKAIEGCAEILEVAAKEYDTLSNMLMNADAMDSVSAEYRNALRDGCKVNLELSRNLYAVTAAIKTSSDGSIFPNS